jgi:uncharacterized membrane protein HdeD (DUF308 family)
MDLIETAFFVVIGVALYDWLSVTGAAARFTSFDYQYSPISSPRWIGIAMLAAGMFVTFALMNPPEPPGRLWIMLPGLFGLLFHGCLTISDFLHQKSIAISDPDGS